MIDACRLCGCNWLVLYYTEGVNREYPYYMCTRCRLVSYDITCGFDQQKHMEHLVDPNDQNSRINRGPRITYEFIKKKRIKPGLMLDVGCGNGALLLSAKKEGWTVKGIDIFHEISNFVKKTSDMDVMVANFLDYTPAQNEAYDLITLRHVLEHLVDPVAAMNKINTLLKKGGVSVLEFPNIRSLNLRLKYFLRRHGLAKWTQKDYVPHHANEFCKQSFLYLLARTGFQLESWTTYSSKPYISGCYSFFGFGTKARVLIRKTEEITYSNTRFS